MERAKLEASNLKELQAEAAKYQLPMSNDRAVLLESILTHFERNGPVADFLGVGEVGRRVESNQTSEVGEQAAASTKIVEIVLQDIVSLTRLERYNQSAR
jgi:hypothetical protein